MAEAVVSAVINKIVDIAANYILGERHRLGLLPEDVRWLEQQMRHMQAYLEDAEAKKFTNRNVVIFIQAMRDLVHDVEDIMDMHCCLAGSVDSTSNNSNGLVDRIITYFWPYGLTSGFFCREIEKIRRRVGDIDADRTRYGIGEDISRTEAVSNVDPRIIKLHVDDPIIIGFEKDTEELRSKLEEHPFVCIVGMPGLGKTTLAKKVFKGIEDGFTYSVSISISQNPNIKNLIQDIAKKVGLEEEKQEENLEENLYSFLERKRYLIFLDDIWNNEVWDHLKGCFPIDYKSGSRIIITSCNNSVGRYIGGEKSLHKLHTFDHSTSWELFSGLIGMPFPELEMIGKQIVKKCGGVPLAIALIVGMLREREMTEFSWNGVLHGIGENANDKCLQILGLSYGDLPTFLKPCFLYFGNFPEDYEFSASEVIRLWMAEKFIPLVRGDWEPEDVGAEYISKLESRNLIQVVEKEHDGRVKKFCIHDLLHSFCVNKGREIDFLDTVDRPESSFAKRVRRLSIHCNDFVAENGKLISQTTKLRALFDFGTKLECVDKMFGEFKWLQVLKLRQVHRIGGNYNPSEICGLICLNYLEIGSSVSFEIRSNILKLKNLQTLDLALTEGTFTVPIEIWEMEQLRHLLLRNYRILRKDKQVQVLLPNLQTLVGIICTHLQPSWLFKFTKLRKLELEDVTPKIMEVLCGLEPISKKLEVLSLRSLGLYDCSMNSIVSLEKYERLMKLTIKNMEMQQILKLPPSLIELTLIWTKLPDDQMPILKKLPKLKILGLYKDSCFGSEMDCSGADSFPQLEILKLYGLDNLEELIEGEEMGMPNLKQLITKECPKLERIPKRLQHLWMRS